MSDKLNFTKCTENVIKFAHLEGLPLDRQIEELEKLISNINGRCTMNAKTKIIDRALRELKAIKTSQGTADDEAVKVQVDTISLINNHIVDKDGDCSIVLNGTPVKYVTSYLVGRNADFPGMIELELHLSIPNGEIALDINTEMDNITNGR